MRSVLASQSSGQGEVLNEPNHGSPDELSEEPSEGTPIEPCDGSYDDHPDAPLWVLK